MKALVLGAGIVGITTAYELNRDGHEVTVIDREPEPANFTSFSNAGLFAPGHAYAWSSPAAPKILLRSLWRGTELEGHADNAAASLFGGVVACVVSEGHVTSTSVPLAAHLLSESQLVVWVPHVQTATSESRATLPHSVSRPDAVFNLSRVVQLVLALGSNDRERIELGVDDRLHQDHRLEKVPMSRLALDQMAGAGASGCWLSGSGPTVAALVHTGAVAAVEDALSIPELEESGRFMQLKIDVEGLQAAR